MVEFLLLLVLLPIAFYGGRFGLRTLREKALQTPYVAPERPRVHYRDGYDKPDARYVALPGKEARRREEAARDALAGKSSVRQFKRRA